MDETMLNCDHPECDSGYPAFEPLRGLGEIGLLEARRMAEEDGWFSVNAENIDYCPEHAEYGKKEWSL